MPKPHRPGRPQILLVVTAREDWLWADHRLSPNLRCRAPRC